MTTRSLTLHPHEVRAALRGGLGLVVRPVSRDFANAMDAPRGPEDVAEGYPLVEDVYGDIHRAVDLCPLGLPGDKLVCKETWAQLRVQGLVYREGYVSDLPEAPMRPKWRSPATMPAWASRITLEVVGVRCVRCADLSYADALKCGFPDGTPGALVKLERFWTAKYGTRYPWETSWAWAVAVRRGEG